MKKLNICIAGAAALLCFNCGDSNSVNVSGTSEELNEVADKGSSSSGTPGTESSSSINDQKNSSSSINDQNPNSSSSGDVQTPQINDGSLEAYLQQYGLETKHRFDKAVLAFNKSEMVSRTPAMDGSTNSTEFDGEGVRKFVQQNISAEIEATKIGQTLKTIIDRREGDYYVGRTEFCSPEVDPEVLIPADCELETGQFYNVHITDAEEFDLYGEVVNSN